jgi:hypothetical protein
MLHYQYTAIEAVTNRWHDWNNLLIRLSGDYANVCDNMS